jgi:hypothetical protein
MRVMLWILRTGHKFFDFWFNCVFTVAKERFAGEKEFSADLTIIWFTFFGVATAKDSVSLKILIIYNYKSL